MTNHTDRKATLSLSSHECIFRALPLYLFSRRHHHHISMACVCGNFHTAGVISANEISSNDRGCWTSNIFDRPLNMNIQTRLVYIALSCDTFIEPTSDVQLSCVRAAHGYSSSAWRVLSLHSGSSLRELRYATWCVFLFRTRLSPFFVFVRLAWNFFSLHYYPSLAPFSSAFLQHFFSSPAVHCRSRFFRSPKQRRCLSVAIALHSDNELSEMPCELGSTTFRTSAKPLNLLATSFHDFFFFFLTKTTPRGLIMNKEGDFGCCATYRRRPTRR